NAAEEEAQTRSTAPSACKLLEESRKDLGRYPRALVVDIHRDGAVVSVRRHSDLAVRRAVTEGIVEQVRENAKQPCFLGNHRARWRARQLDFDVATSRCGFSLGDDTVQHVVQLDSVRRAERGR